MKNMFDNYYKDFAIIILVVIIIALSIFLINKKEDTNDSSQTSEITYQEEQEEVHEDVNETIKVDIKGAISKPGVYELNKNSIVSDVIKIAGGLSKNADTSNINLSKKVEDEMVIKIFTSTELKKIAKNNEITNDEICSENTIIIDKCNESSLIKDSDTPNINDTNTSSNSSNSSNTQNKSQIISINTATKEEFMTLSGIGESKADSIIKYRQENGLFKSKEDIKNVSGIGEAVYNKIKDYITV